jgi:hypothetical protein
MSNKKKTKKRRRKNVSRHPDHLIWRASDRVSEPRVVLLVAVHPTAAAGSKKKTIIGVGFVISAN